MSGVFETNGAGGVMRPAYHFDTFSAVEAMSTPIPVTGVPQKTQGTRIFSGSIQVPAGRAVEISMSGVVLHTGGTTAMAACWFVDEEVNARGTMAINHIGGGYLAGIHLHDLFVPDDGEPHTIHINVGPAAGTMITNGQSTSSPLYGSTMTATFFLKEL